MTTTPAVRRPALITVLVVLVVISGIGAALTAIIMLTMRDASVGPGIIQAIVALVWFAVAKGLLDGNPLARVVAAAVAVIQIVLALITVIDSTDTARSSSAWGTLVFAVVVLVVLFTPKANAFFAARR